VLLRSPFQAFITPRVLASEMVDAYELVYFTQHNSSEDRHYFRTLAASARNAVYCYAPVRRFDALGYMAFLQQSWRWISDQGRDLTLLSSINDYLFSAIVRRQRHTQLITMDDGTANIFKSGVYHSEISNWRGRLYRRVLGAYDVGDLKRRIARHYTLHPVFENIVSKERLRQISWPKTHFSSNAGKALTFFIGGPFNEVLSSEQIKRLTAYAVGCGIDYYVRHPRETRPLDIGAPILDKQGLIAEDAMVQFANDLPIHVVGSFTSVLFNIGDRAQRKTMVLVKDHPASAELGQMAEMTGCCTVMV
jgi:N-acetyllactosaminide alpha-2,3-sialyltransferase